MILSRRPLLVVVTSLALVTVSTACTTPSAPPAATTASNDVADQVDQSDQGCPGPYPDWETSPYVLPYPVGSAYEIGLDNCSVSFHGEGQPDAFATDFDMPIGADVVAVRSGVVSSVWTDDVDFAGTPGGNQITVDHGDGTEAVYLHFTGDAVDVAIGDEVVQGQVIGRAGASGTNAGYPHLHLIVVESPAAYPWQGIPITFSNTDPNPRGPVTGVTYEAR